MNRIRTSTSFDLIRMLTWFTVLAIALVYAGVLARIFL